MRHHQENRCVLAMLLVASATAWASPTIIATNQQVGLTAQLPAGCLSTAGEAVDFSAPGRTLWYYRTTATRLKNGFYSFAIQAAGVGETSKAAYHAYGSDVETFANFDSFGDGTFVITQNLHVTRNNGRGR